MTLKRITAARGSVLGLNYSGMHDSALALVEPSGRVAFASSLERITRVKQDGRPPVALLEALDWDCVDRIAVSCPKAFQAPTNPVSVLHPAPLPKPRKDFVFEHGPQFEEFLASLAKPIDYVCHQDAHAASAFWLSGFQDATCLTYDGGMFNSPWFGGLYSASQSEGLQPLDRFAASHYQKITTAYSAITGLLGFTPNKHEGKVTGLAAYGKAEPACRALMEEVFFQRYYEFENSVEWFLAYSKETTPQFAVREFKRKELQQVFKDFSRETMAATIQTMAEEHVLEILSRAQAQGWLKERICLAGGLFANVKINQRVQEFGFQEIFVTPPMTDDGSALGAALHSLASNEKSLRSQRLDHVFWGPSYTAQEIEGALKKWGLTYHKSQEPARNLAQRLADGHVVAVFQGGMEFGPRALGNRSILSAATDPSINQTLNQRLCRTEFMPFAPMTLAEDAAKMYPALKGAEHTAEFMTITCACSEEMKKFSPAVVHVDGTARPQLIRADKHPFIAETLKAYKELTGLPSIINTSFNIHEEPIVCSPDDAIQGFLESGLDYLFLEGGFHVAFAENHEVALQHFMKSRAFPSQKEQHQAALITTMWDQIGELLGYCAQIPPKQVMIQSLTDICQERLDLINEMDAEIRRLRKREARSWWDKVTQKEP